MSDSTAPRLVGGVHLEHSRDADSYAFLTVDRRLKSGKLDTIALTEEELVRLIAEAAGALRVLWRQRQVA